MGKNICLLCCFLIKIGCLTGQTTLPLIPEPGNYAMGGVISPFDSRFQPAGSPAVLAQSNGWGVGFYAAMPFGVDALTTTWLHGWMPSGKGGAGLALGYSGFGNLRHLMGSLAFGHRLWGKLDAGMAMEMQYFEIVDFGQVLNIGITPAFNFRITDQLGFGVTIRNMVTTNTRSATEMPRIASFSIGYKAHSALLIGAEWQQQTGTKADLRIGIEYMPHPSVAVRIGYQSLTNAFTAGAGYVMNNGFRIQIGAGHHPALGFSPIAGIVYVSSRKA